MEYNLILDMIENNPSILDLGCGDGSLSKRLIEEKGCKVIGLDLSEEAVKLARKNGIDARVGDLEKRLDFESNSFDYVILCDVLEHLFDPLFSLKEALRVSKKYVIIAFPNFAFFKSRFQLMFKGEFPKSPLFGRAWYNSQHIRLFSYKDFIHTIKVLNFQVKINKKSFIYPRFIPSMLVNAFPNLLSIVCVLRLKKKPNWDLSRIATYSFDV